MNGATESIRDASNMIEVSLLKKVLGLFSNVPFDKIRKWINGPSKENIMTFTAK